MSPESDSPAIRIRGCRQHNLKNLDFDIPLGKLTVVTGPSGSGKSSLAFHTLYAEGQRRYVETFSPYVRQFFDRMDKPEVDSIDGIPPAIAIEQKNHVRTSRSTVGTLTEIDDYLKLLYPRLATAFDPDTGEEIRPDSPESAAAWAIENLSGQPTLITFPVPVPPGTKPEDLFPFLHQQGYLRILANGKILRTDEPAPPTKLPAAISVIQDRISLSNKTFPRLLEALEAAFRLGKGHASIHVAAASQPPTTPNVSSRAFSTTWSNPRTGFTLRAPTASLFSFNNPLGACPKCRGFGRIIGIDLAKTVPDLSLSIAHGAVKPFQGERGEECQRDLLRCMHERGIDPHTPFENLSQSEQEWIYYGDRKKPELTAEELEDLWQSGAWYGVMGFFEWLETKAYKMHVRVFLSRFRSYTTCPACRGKRLQPDALCFKIDGKTLPDLWAMSVADLLAWFTSLSGCGFQPQAVPAASSRKSSPSKPDPTLDLVLKNISSRLSYLDQVGLGYLTLDRTTRTLSGGEVERVNLTTCLGASLTNTLFVLDEPTVGLHARDIDRLVKVMLDLRDKGNTLVVVEHEEAVMRAADQLLDIGPASGHLGGEIIYHGPATLPMNEGIPPKPKKNTKPATKNPSLPPQEKFTAPCPDFGTLPWLTGQKSIPIPTTRRKAKHHIRLRGISRHNIRKLDVDLPVGVFTCLTGVSGSGKSTLAHDGIYLNLARHFRIENEADPAPLKSLTVPADLSGVELVDQSPTARTPRSTPAVFLGAFNEIRQLFAQTDAATAAGHNTGFFSFNSGDGRCDRCGGNGFEKVEMQFLSDVYVTCPACNGRRYKPSTLEIQYSGKSIADILDLTTDEAISFYSRNLETLPAPTRKRHTSIINSLAPLTEVGLGYVKLGQPLNTLSGGESQRLKLCQLLTATTRRGFQPQTIAAASRKLLILDEPTTGLHFTDISRLLQVFQKLAAAGHTLLVIEHNYEVIKSADWIIDLGPGAGKNGGQIVAEGTPEDIATLETETARHLRPHLHGGRSFQPQAVPAASSREPAPTSSISLSGARHHNLKNISLDIPRDQFVVLSGLSGSGKSTLAFDILFAEGQRRFLDSMSAYARQFAEQLEKPEIDQLLGLPPTVAIEQRVSQGGVKSTVATVTELWNFIRLLFSKLGTLHCPDCQIPVEQQSVSAIESTVLRHLKDGPVKLLAPLIRGKKGYHTEIAEWAVRHGYTTLLVDGKFREAATFTRLERFKEHDIDVVVAETTNESAKDRAKLSSPLITSLPTALEIGKGFIKLHTAAGKLIPLSTHCACPKCDRSFEPLDPRLFSFNSPHGWCPTCRGHGRVPKRKRHLDTSRFESVLEAELDEDRAIARMENDELSQCPACHGSRLNPIASAVRLQNNVTAESSGWDNLSQPVAGTTCPDPISTAQLATLTISSAADFFSTLDYTEKREALIARDILPEIKQRLTFLIEVGLGYLQLDRSGNTLSGGESQRIRLAAQLGSNLRGVLYVLDEPTIGLHPRDNAALLKTLIGLRDHGNSLIVVEHDEDTIAAADHLIDLGPAAGRLGGQIVYQGVPPQLSGHPLSVVSARKKKGAKPSSSLITDHRSLITSSSPTLRAFAHPLHHPTRGKRRTVKKDHPLLTITGCRANNLKHITASIPLGRLTVLTGISGSGKSTLMHQCIAAAFQKKNHHQPFSKVTGESSIKAVYEVDQSPIGKTSRSCPATYVKVFDHIRALFAQMPDARMRGYDASRFSFNTDGGRCPDCGGNGRVKLEMDFLPPTWVHCETCDGQRYNPATLDVLFREKSIADVLSMTIDDASSFFESQPRISAPLKLMADTGLGYLQLGQPSPTLSGGEAQRIKLVSELIKGRSLKARLSGKASANLYLIEEPTVGLHLEDIKRLIDILHRLVDEGHTVVVIEHHMAIAAEADWLLDLGPEAGENGGTIVAQGTPESVAKSKTSRTAPFLKTALA